MHLIYLNPTEASFSLFLYHTLSFWLFGYLLAVKFTSIYTFLSNSFAIRWLPPVALPRLHWGSDLTLHVRKVQPLTSTSCWRGWQSLSTSRRPDFAKRRWVQGQAITTESQTQFKHQRFNTHNILRALVFLGRDEKCCFFQWSNRWVLRDESPYACSHCYCILLWPTLQSNWNGWKVMLYLCGAQKKKKKSDKFWYTLKRSSRTATGQLYQKDSLPVRCNQLGKKKWVFGIQEHCYENKKILKIRIFQVFSLVCRWCSSSMITLWGTVQCKHVT